MSGYGSDPGFQAWLDENGYALSDGHRALAVLRQRGSSYVDGLYGSRFVGTPTGGLAQERQWPRTGAEAYSTSIGDAVVPKAIEFASYAAALHEDQNPDSLAAAVTGAGTIKREKVGALETEYFEGQGSAVENATVILSEVEGLVAPFLKTDMSETPMMIWSVGR